jgi:hypothetical protein
MKKIALFILMMSTFSWAGPNPDEYPINIRVCSSHWVREVVTYGSMGFQKLDVTIDGKKYELEAVSPGDIQNTRSGVPVLALGDYKAKLVKDGQKTTYELSQIYEILLPDQKTRKFVVVGQTE